MTREIATRTRRDLASWQKAALGLLALSVGANTLLYGAILSRDMAQAMGVTAAYISTRMTGKS